MKFKTAIFLTFALCGYSFGNPEGSAVVSGDVDIQTDGLNLNITASDRAIIEWQDFSIDAGETTRFLQPSSNAAVLNQVRSNIPSSIDGNLLGNGNVYLMNPNGVIIGANGVVDTGGFLATTLDQGTANFFENGQLELLGDSDAAIVNMGNITATGDIFLVATKIDNQGLIQSTNGFVGLAAGKDVLLKEAGEERIFIRPVGEGEIDISGTIEALDIEIKSRGNAFSTAINLEGQLTANKVNEVGGRVFLSADNRGIVLGDITADADVTIESGGAITEANPSGIDSVNITANTLSLTAGDGIGSTGTISDVLTGPAGGIDVAVTTLDAVNTISGDIVINNVDGVYTVLLANTDYSSVDLNSGNVEVTANSGSISITDGAITTSGSAVYNVDGATTLVADSGAINYSQFDISVNETVQFIQPNFSVGRWKRLRRSDN